MYTHVKFEVGSWPASSIAKIYQDACVLVWLAFARLDICSKMCRYEVIMTVSLSAVLGRLLGQVLLVRYVNPCLP